MKMKPGTKLANGAIALAMSTDGKRVLAYTAGHQPFVIWIIDEQGNTTSGRYFTDIVIACQKLG